MLKLKFGVAAFLATAIAQSAAGAAAGTPDLGSPNAAKVVVRYADLDLATPLGAHVLRARVDRAAMLVMGSVDLRDLGRVAELRKARATALAAANAIIAAHAGTSYAATSPAPNKLDL